MYRDASVGQVTQLAADSLKSFARRSRGASPLLDARRYIKEDPLDVVSAGSNCSGPVECLDLEEGRLRTVLVGDGVSLRDL